MLAASVGSCRARKCSGRAGTRRKSSFPSRRPGWSGWAGTVLAMAASFFLMFWVGSMVKQAFLGRPVTPPGTLGQFADATRPPATMPNRSALSRPSQLAPQPQPSLAGMLPQGRSPFGSWRMVTVSSPTGGGKQGSSFRVPAVERDNIDQQWLRSFPPAIPDDVLQAFNRTGHEVEQHRELVPVPLKDGRRLVVPVDQVDVHYVGHQTD